MQQALALFDDSLTIEDWIAKKEDQYFDRKSPRIHANQLANSLIGFANADGGTIVVGISNGQVLGVDSDVKHLNSLQQAALDFTSPCVSNTSRLVECVNSVGKQDHLLVFDIQPSERVVHRNRGQECYLRIGDENRHLSLSEEQQLIFDKGEQFYDKTIVEDVTLDDLDMQAVEAYARIRKTDDIMRLMRARGLYINNEYRKGVTQAGHLLFGKFPPIWSYVRYLRYDGVTAETGVRSNLVNDIRFEAAIPTMIDEAKALLAEELMVIRQTPNGRFNRILAIPEFAWLEAVVNAVTHRSYSLYGDGIRITQYTDRLEVFSPGRLPNLVRVSNISNTRFSRNPHIARVLAETTDYVREQNEGVKRMFSEMEQYGLEKPVFKVSEAGVVVTLYKVKLGASSSSVVPEAPSVTRLRDLIGSDQLTRLFAELERRQQLSTGDVATLLGVSNNSARKYLLLLQDASVVRERLRAKFDPGGTWTLINS